MLSSFNSSFPLGISLSGSSTHDSLRGTSWGLRSAGGGSVSGKRNAAAAAVVEAVAAGGAEAAPALGAALAAFWLECCRRGRYSSWASLPGCPAALRYSAAETASNFAAKIDFKSN